MPTPEEMTRTMIDNMPAKTGRSLEEWLAIVRRSGLTKHGEIVAHLKAQHGMTHGFANLVAHSQLQAAAGGAPPEDDLVAAQYAGAKAGLRPIYDRLLAAVTAFGDDVEVAPKKAYVSLRRNRQFGILKPSTAKRMDVGVHFGADAPDSPRVADGKAFGGMVSHQVAVSGPAEVDDELLGWLRAAYERA